MTFVTGPRDATASTGVQTAQPSTIAADLLSFCAHRVHDTATRRWPTESLTFGPQAPSVTSYVQHIRVADRALYAKHSVLGTSLVSVARGACGTWPQARAAQTAYETAPGALLAREYAQLRALTATGIPTTEPVAHESGVLFISPVTGPTLIDLLLADPRTATDRLLRAVDCLDRLQHPLLAHRARVSPIAERGIEPTFRRKFTGPHVDAYLAEIAVRHHLDPTLLATAVDHLMRVEIPPPTGTLVLYGDLKPEHVLYPNGPDRPPTYIDPGLRHGPALEDSTKLLSRVLLHLLLTTPPAAPQLIEGVHDFALRRLKTVPGPHRARAEQRLTANWLMDSLNIVSTYLSAPDGLPLPAQGQAVADRAGLVLDVLARAATTLADGGSWETALDTVRWGVTQ